MLGISMVSQPICRTLEYEAGIATVMAYRPELIVTAIPTLCQI